MAHLCELRWGLPFAPWCVHEHWGFLSFFMLGDKHEVILAIPPPPSPPGVFLSSDRAVSPYVKPRHSPPSSALLLPNVAPFPPASFLNEPLRASEQLLAPSCPDTICVLSLFVLSGATGGHSCDYPCGLLLASSFLLVHFPLILPCSLLSIHYGFFSEQFC